MSRFRSPRRTSPASTVPLPHPVPWFLVTVLLAGAAGAALYGAATGIPPAAVPVVTTEQAAAGLDVAAALLAVSALLALRRFLYDRLARRPGPVEITSFAGDPKHDGVRPEDVLAEFRRALAGMSLSSPEPVPNAPAADGVLDDVRTAFDGQRNAVSAAVLLLVSVVRIRYAYRVSVQLLAPGPGGECALSVHVSRLPSGSGEVRTVRAPDWPSAARRAGHLVGAYVVPRSRLSRRAPWRAWHGLDMPARLFDRSQEASAHIRARRYEQAMSALHAALDSDPQNPYLRIQIGQVQEQLGLFMDATVTYADVVAIESWHDRRLWCRLRVLLADDTTGGPPPRLRRNPDGRDALLVARYRLVSRLASAEQLAEQWQRVPREPRNERREAEHAALRARMRVWLRSYVRYYAAEHRTRPSTASARQVLSTLEHAPRPAFRHFLQFVALHETNSLIDDYRWSRGRRRPGMLVSQTGLNLMREWSRLYMNLAAHELDPSADAGWPPDPALLDLRIARYLALKPGRARGWQEYYNAACTVAVALNGEDVPRRRKVLALQAVRHLERAVSCTDSGFVGRYAQWLSTGDPDLNPLRGTAEFVDFLDRYLPNPDPRIPRPDELLLPLVMSHHTLRLLGSFAERRAAELRAAASRWTSMTDADRKREHEVRDAAAAYARDDRHWQTRAKLIAQAATAPGLPELRTDLPRFQDDPEVRELAGGQGADPSATGTAYRPDRTAAWDPARLREHFEGVIERRGRAWSSVVALIDDAREVPVRRAAAARFWDDLAARIGADLRPEPARDPVSRG